MNLTDYQRAAARTSDPSRDQRDRLSNAALGLAGEAGEVVELVKKHLHHGHDLDSAKLARELGDVLWYIAETCNVLGLDLASVARANVAKLQQRYPEGFNSQASRERADVPPTKHAEQFSGFEWASGIGTPQRPVVAATIHELRPGALAAFGAWLKSGSRVKPDEEGWPHISTTIRSEPTTPPHIPADASLVDTLTTAQEHIREALGSAQEAHGRRLYEVGVEYVSADGGRRGVVHKSREIRGAFDVVVGNAIRDLARDTYGTYHKAEASIRKWLGPDARKATEVCEGRR